jgi:hypothetical protein
LHVLLLSRHGEPLPPAGFTDHRTTLQRKTCRELLTEDAQ